MSSDATTDWEMVFEDPETGLIPLVLRAPTPEILRKSGQVVFRKLLKRKDDELKLEEFTGALDKIVPRDALTNDLDLMRDGVTKLLRRIKRQRIRKAAEYRVSKYAEKDAERRASKTGYHQQVPVWKKVIPSRRAALILAGLAASLVAIVMNAGSSYDAREREAQGKIAVQWVRSYVRGHLQLTSLILKDVKLSGDSIIELDINVSESRDVTLFKALKVDPRTTRGEILDVVCPSPTSGVFKILDQGWTLSVVIKNKNKKIIDGNCQYQRG